LRAEMERAMPMYKGIASLRAEGDSVQYGGQLLCAGGVCANLPGGRARFTPLAPPPDASVILSPDALNRGEESLFYLTTRRGKQFNSMLWSTTDPVTGAARRDAIFISHEDAHRLSLRDGDAVLLRATAANPATREMRGTCKIASLKSGTLQAFWPEANVLISSRLDPASHEPDYNAWVTLKKL